MSSVIEQLRDQASRRLRRILLPETQDPRILEAADLIREQNLAIPVVLDRRDCPTRDALKRFEVIEIDDVRFADACAQQLFENRQHKGLTREAAKSAIGDPLLYSALLLKIGAVDGAVAGSVASTSSVIRAALHGVGMAENCKTVSSFFLMQFPDRAVTFSDCGVVPDPDATQLAEIAISAAGSHYKLTGQTPRVAMLSFSTLGSAEHGDVDKVRQACELVRQRQPKIIVDGELQFDAAWVPEVALRKAPDSPVAGQANVFVFPDLNSGNIAYKIAERLGGAQALGPLIQGVQRPFMDLSRGCQIQDIIDVVVIASVLAP
jgi:phosphate acetyltransferase